ncbi:hypothetical protein EV176_004345 [Coemansia sp. RSA 451]|nr:hypothetical protein EV176_004345 [Coemansia sp. RSA 451]KAJ2414343.1 hypothetical protein GGF47_005735 [Coemansia sp. RSA 2524]
MSTEPIKYIFTHYGSEGKYQAGPIEISAAEIAPESSGEESDLTDKNTIEWLGEEAKSRFSVSSDYFLCSPDCGDTEKDKSLPPSMAPEVCGLKDGARIYLVEFTDPDTISQLIADIYGST